MTKPGLIESVAMSRLERSISAGTLSLISPSGRERTFTAAAAGPDAQLIVNDWRVLEAVLARGDIGLGEAYMKGWWDSPDLEAFIAFSIANVDSLGRLAWGSPLHRLASIVTNRLLRRNSLSGSRRNIMAHYDLGNAFYALWLDKSMSYSSAIYASPDDALESAQQRKYKRILERLGNCDRVLEIGCGWGGFICEAERQHRHVTALTISSEQYAFVRDRSGKNVDVMLQDYRQSSGRYPAIVSIEMLEAVGEPYWPLYFRTLRDRLTDDGVAVVQTISIRDDMFQSYRGCSDYIRHFIFPGGMLPSLSRLATEAEKAGLQIRHVYSFGKDYAKTLRAWLERFEAARGPIQSLGYDDGFIRGWRLYLAMCAAAFEVGRTNVHQIELVPVPR